MLHPTIPDLPWDVITMILEMADLSIDTRRELKLSPRRISVEKEFASRLSERRVLNDMRSHHFIRIACSRYHYVFVKHNGHFYLDSPSDAHLLYYPKGAPIDPLYSSLDMSLCVSSH